MCIKCEFININILTDGVYCIYQSIYKGKFSHEKYLIKYNVEGVILYPRL